MFGDIDATDTVSLDDIDYRSTTHYEISVLERVQYILDICRRTGYAYDIRGTGKVVLPAKKGAPAEVVSDEIVSCLIPGATQKAIEALTIEYHTYIPPAALATIFLLSQRESAYTSIDKVETINPTGINIDHNDADKALWHGFAVVSTGSNPVLLYRHHNTYAKVPEKAYGDYDIDAVLNEADAHQACRMRFDSMVEKWQAEMLDIRNAGGAYEKNLIAYLISNVPIAILKRATIKIHGRDVGGVVIYDSVLISAKDKKQICYTEALDLSKSIYSTSLCERLNQMPKIYTNDEDAPAFHYHDITQYADTGLTWENLPPAWLECLSKYTRGEAELIMAWLFGVMYAKNASRQALCFYDAQGYSGKTALAKALMTYLGNTLVASVDHNSMTNQFWASAIWDKRLVLMSDSKNANIIKSATIHNITGGDPVSVENKGQRPFSAVLSAKLLINTNTPLSIDTDLTHEVSRLLVVKPVVTEAHLKRIALTDANGNLVYDALGKPQLIGDPTFIPKLVDGFPTMLKVAYTYYKKLCPTDGEYIVPSAVLDNVKDCESNESINHADIFNDLLEYTDNINDYESPRNIEHAFDQYVSDNMPKLHGDKYAWTNFRTYITKVYFGSSRNVGRKHTNHKMIDGKDTRVWQYIKLRSQPSKSPITPQMQYRMDQISKINSAIIAMPHNEIQKLADSLNQNGGN